MKLMTVVSVVTNFRYCRGVSAALLGFTMCVLLSHPSYAAYGKVPKTNVDPSIMNIDEDKFLGVSLQSDYQLLNSRGEEFTMSEMLGKPLLLVLSYYSCDGACSAINRVLKNTLESVKAWKLGRDYRVLTVSFDKYDNAETINKFLQHSGFENGPLDGWKVATFKNSADIERLTGVIGYRYNWEPRDRVFLHPSVYVMLSPGGRVTRYLYASSVTPEDVEVSITKAYGDELSPSRFLNFVVGTCYSYNYREGRYTLNYPIFIALIALAIGVVSLLCGSLIMRRRARI